MRSKRSLSFVVRIEDAIALFFFLLNLVVLLITREVRQENLDPTDVLVILPAVCLLLGKQVITYFLSPTKGREGSGEDLREFLRPYWRIVRDWFPFLIILLMYYSLWGNATHWWVTTDRDAQLAALDQKWFGFQASVALQRWIRPWLTSWMEFAYAFHLLNIPIVACFLYLRRSHVRFREMMCGLIVVSFLGLVGYLLVPAVGPLYFLRDRYSVALLQPVEAFNRQMQFLDFARIRRDVFPSLHVGISFVVWLFAYRNSRRLFWCLAPFIVSLWISTVYLRYHYLVDCLAGLVLAPISCWLANGLVRRFGEISLSWAFPEGRVSRLVGARPSEQKGLPEAQRPAAPAVKAQDGWEERL